MMMAKMDVVPPMVAVRKRWADMGSDDGHLRDPWKSALQAQCKSQMMDDPSHSAEQVVEATVNGVARSIETQ